MYLKTIHILPSCYEFRMKTKSDNYTFLIGGLSMAILFYVVFRAINLSITHDEAFTYTRYVNHSYAEIVTYETGNILPNNHILNTVSQKFFSFFKSYHY